MNSRKKGIVFEQEMVRRLKEVWPDVSTSRFQGALWWDYAKVDLVGTPGFHFQCKAVEHLSPGPHEILSAMPLGTSINVVLHKKNHKGTTAILKLDDFLRLVGACNECFGLQAMNKQNTEAPSGRLSER